MKHEQTRSKCMNWMKMAKTWWPFRMEAFAETNPPSRISSQLATGGSHHLIVIFFGVVFAERSAGERKHFHLHYRSPNPERGQGKVEGEEVSQWFTNTGGRSTGIYRGKFWFAAIAGLGGLVVGNGCKTWRKAVARSPHDHGYDFKERKGGNRILLNYHYVLVVTKPLEDWLKSKGS